MAAHVEVMSTDLRRVKVKVSPGTYMLDVLVEACEKLKLDSDKYLLKHKQKNIDLTGPFRTAGLGPGAKLELVKKSKSASVVSIAIDVAGGQRYTRKLPSDMSLWQVMRQFETNETNLNLTGRGVPKSESDGQLYHEAPVINIMGREYSALEDLQKSLSQCGINSGSMVLRLSFKLTDRTLFDAMSQIERFLKDSGPGPSTETDRTPSRPFQPVAESAPPAADAEEPLIDLNPPVPKESPSNTEAGPHPTVESNAAPVAPPTSDLMDLDDSPAPAAAAATAPVNPLLPTNVFSEPSSGVPAAAYTKEDDSIYEPTIAHAQLRQKHLEQRAQNTRLKSDAELATDAAAEEAKLAKIQQVNIKVRFPDQTSAIWTFGPDDTGALLYKAVRSVMAHPNQPFHLILPGPKTVIRDDAKSLVKGYRVATRDMLHLVWDDKASAAARKGPFLKDSVASKAKAVVVPDIPQGAQGEDDAGAGPSRPPPVKKEGNDALDTDAIKKKLGKWLKLPGGKK